MNLKKLWAGLISAVVLCCGLVTATYAKSDPLSDMWIVYPHPGQETQFEEAFKNHLKFRQSKGDPRAWKTYVPAIGDDLSGYYVRYCCVQWADADTYRDWSNEHKLGEHWNNTVHQYVHRYEHYFSEMDTGNSNWPDDESAMKYFGVTHYHPKLGHNAGIEKVKAQLSQHAKAMKWPYAWSWSRTVGGQNALNLVIGYENYAGMAPPPQSFMEALGEHLKSEQKAAEILQNWVANFNQTTYTVYQLRDDLSMSAKQ